MKYLSDLGVKLDEAAVLTVLTELNAPTMGEFTREGFINGWSNHRYLLQPSLPPFSNPNTPYPSISLTPPPSADTLPKQHQTTLSFRRSLTTSPPFFRKTYKSTFPLARLPGAKVLPLDTAIDYWRLLFTAPSVAWSTPQTPWLEWWIEYLETRWKKAISKDMWDQTGSFMAKTLEDEGMGWWSEDGAWPGVLDEFVGFVRERRGVGEGSEMDVG